MFNSMKDMYSKFGVFYSGIYKSLRTYAYMFNLKKDLSTKSDVFSWWR